SVVGADNSRVAEQTDAHKRSWSGSSQPGNARLTPVNVKEGQPSHAKAGVRRAPRDPGTGRPARTLVSRDHRPTGDRLTPRNSQERQPSHAKAGVRLASHDPGTERPA